MSDESRLPRYGIFVLDSGRRSFWQWNQDDLRTTESDHDERPEIPVQAFAASHERRISQAIDQRTTRTVAVQHLDGELRVGISSPRCHNEGREQLLLIHEVHRPESVRGRIPLEVRSIRQGLERNLRRGKIEEFLVSFFPYQSILVRF